MRLYAFLLVVTVARAATIPASETEKKINAVPENVDKVPENTSSEQELIDQSNIIKDVENNLRVKPEDIPVEVIVEDSQLGLKTNAEKVESEEINRPVPDLRNPGPPQHQEHDTQNPEYYATEQQAALAFKQSINDAQNVLHKGFQRIAEGIQNMIASNEPIQTIQQNIQSFREGFTTQINKLNGTIQSYLNAESSNVNEPVVEKTRASFQEVEQGLFKLRNDFNRGVNTLVDGVGIVASLKADNENNPSSGAVPAPAPPAPVRPFAEYLQNIQNNLNSALQNMTETINKFNPFNQANQASTTASAPQGVQADSQVTSAPAPAPPNNLWQNWQNWQQQLNNTVANSWNNFLNGIFFVPQSTQPTPVAQPVPAEKPTQSVSKPSETVKPSETDKPSEESKPESSAEPAKPVDSAQTAAITPAPGPIRQILQNNPISKGIANAVQRLQNINNPEKPRDVEKQKIEEAVVVEVKDEVKPNNDSKNNGKGGNPNNGDNNDSSDSRIEQPEAVKEDAEKLSEVKKEEEQKTEQVVDKTE